MNTQSESFFVFVLVKNSVSTMSTLSKCQSTLQKVTKLKRYLRAIESELEDIISDLQRSTLSISLDNNLMTNQSLDTTLQSGSNLDTGILDDELQLAQDSYEESMTPTVKLSEDTYFSNEDDDIEILNPSLTYVYYVAYLNDDGQVLRQSEEQIEITRNSVVNVIVNHWNAQSAKQVTRVCIHEPQEFQLVTRLPSIALDQPIPTNKLIYLLVH